MKIFRSPAIRLPSRFRKSVATIGIFDGVHIGHAVILKQAVRRARQLQRKSLAITFNPHPAAVLTPGNVPPLLMSLEHRLVVFEKMGFDACWVIHFTERIAGLGAWQFVRDFLVRKFNIAELWIGKGFLFGRGNLGTAEFLKLMGVFYRFSVHEIAPVRLGKQKISSSRIRRLIEKGRLKRAERLLGRPVSILGTVVRGMNLGGKIGFPTANVDPHHEAIPARGVYAVWVLFNGKRYRGVTNVGIRPTITKNKKQRTTVEVHLLHFEKNLYHKEIEIHFVKKLRDEKRFPSLRHLSRQIQRDIRKARQVLKATTRFH